MSECVGGWVGGRVGGWVGGWLGEWPVVCACVFVQTHHACVVCVGETGIACELAYAHLYIDTFHLHILHTSYTTTSQNKKTRRSTINVLVILKSAEVFLRSTPTHDVSLPLCVSSHAMPHTHLGVGVRWIDLILSQTPKAP